MKHENYTLDNHPDRGLEFKYLLTLADETHFRLPFNVSLVLVRPIWSLFDYPVSLVPRWPWSSR